MLGSEGPTAGSSPGSRPKDRHEAPYLRCSLGACEARTANGTESRSLEPGTVSTDRERGRNFDDEPEIGLRACARWFAAWAPRP